MKPMIQLRTMNELSNLKRRKICEHKPPCGKFLVINTINDGLTLCHKDAIEYGYAILDELSILPKEVKKCVGWNPEKTRALIDYIRNHEIKYGTYGQLAVELGVTRQQIKDKVRYLRAKGVV